MDEQLVAMLRDILDRAERGEVIAIAIATVGPDLSTGSVYRLGGSTLSELLGAIALLQYRVCLNSDHLVD